MRKAFQFLLLTAFVLAPLSLAQNLNQATKNTSATHGVTVEIPRLAMIKIVNANNTTTSGTAQVTFNLLNDPSFVSQGFSGTYTSGSSAFSESGFADIEVIANGGWTVTVSTTNWTGIAANGSSLSTHFVDGSNITVTPTGTAGAAVTPAGTSFTLPNTGGGSKSVASGTRTTGWQSLGFNAKDYALKLNGTEPAGTYSFTVDYTITTP